MSQTPLNLVIIGNGHYATGITNISGKRTTDKDLGVLLPAALALREAGLVGDISIAGRDGSKFDQLAPRLRQIQDICGWNTKVSTYPKTRKEVPDAYRDALHEIAKPAAALIAVPDHQHVPVMQTCIEHGVPFLIVKPAVTSLASLYELLDRLKQQPLPAWVDYHKVYDLANLVLRQDLQAGRYGPVQHILSKMTQRRDMLDIYGRWFTSDAPPNINHYLGSHYIHMTAYLTGAEPLDVRATAQYGWAQQQLERDIADLIQTQVRWRSPDGSAFTSYHIAGWADPRETAGMTYQQLHLICERGHIDSDQRDRGFQTVLSGQGTAIRNPYFFNLVPRPGGAVTMDDQYGYTSVKTFVEAVLHFYQTGTIPEIWDQQYPTLAESQRVTAILEAADLSLSQGSAVVKVTRDNERYRLSPASAT
jgi:predicted dehydrogenase